METDSDTPDIGGGGPRRSGIRWPPPGLERMQGDLGRVAGRAALGGLVLVLPILFVVARDLPFATLGPFADAWWVTVVLAVVGLTFAMDALFSTVRMMRRAARALERGYDLGTVSSVLADTARDTGFLLTGARHFSVVDAREREAIATIRVFSKAMYAAAGVWLPNALAIGLLLGARGVVTPGGLWMSTLLPALAMYVFGAVAGAVEESRVKRARQKWHQQPWKDDLTSAEAKDWQSAYAAAAAVPTGGAAPATLPRTLRRLAIVVAILAAVVSLPILTLLPTSAVGPVLATMAVPGFQEVRTRAARAEALRSYRVATDASLGPAEAGQLLHDLLFVGSDRVPSPGVLPPSRRVARPWVPRLAGVSPIGLDVFAWSDSLMSIASTGLSAEQRDFLRDVATHPARADFSRLARAAAVDIASARHPSPLPEEITVSTLPLPQLSGLRMGAYTHVGVAAAEMVEGRLDSAESLLAEVISVGLLLGDAGPTLIDNAIGYALVEAGARALADFYEVSGQSDKADRLASLRGASERAARRTRFEAPPGPEAWIRSLPALVEDPSLPRGLRWEYFIGITTLTPCINLHRMVFGPDEEYADFVANARESLVEWPSEAGLFEVARGGWFGQAAPATSLFGRLLGVSMRRGESACGEIVRSVESARALF